MAPSNSNAGIGGNAVSGTEIIIEAVPGKTIKLPFASFEDITFTQNAGNLIVTPAEGGEPVLLQDFLTFGVTENPPKIEFINGEVMEISQITPLVQGYSVADINPQAGEDYSAGGGASFQPFHEGSIGDPLGIADLLPPTELSFARDEIDEIIGENQDINPFSNPNPDEPFGRVALSFETPRGQVGSDSGGYEDWQPNQNVGDTTEYPMQVVVNFTPDTDEELTSVDISGFPAGSKFFVGGTGPGNEVDVTSGNVSVAAVGGVLPVMYLLPPANSDADIPIDVTANFVDGGGLTGTADVSSIAVIDAAADAPALSGGDATGSEDTAISIPEISAALQDTDGSESLNVSIGGVPVGATLSDGVNNFLGDGSDVDVTGWDLANLTIKPVADDDTDFSLTVTATATEGATVAGGGELTDANNTATTSFTIDVTVNDGPTAVADGPDYISEPLDTHAVFVIDTSASLSQSELALMEDALKNLATTLFTQNPEGTKITLIDFDSSARFIGGGDGTFTTLASVLTALDNLDSSSGGSTNYDSALDLTRTVNFEQGYEKAIYFISDGQPTQGNTQGGINDFNNWVTNDLGGADVYAVGIGSDAQNSIYLGQIDNTPIDNNNDPNPGDPYLYVAAPGDLDASLVTSNVHLEGNVLDNDVPGTDPLAAVPIVSIAYKGVTYDLGDGADPNVTVDGNVLTLDSDFGVLTLNFETGEYSYIANTDISNFENELFSYTIADTGGSTSTAVLTIQITPDSSYTGTPGADDIIGGTGNDYIAGQAGDDSLFGGNGDDRFVFQNASTDGHDVIHDFGANGDSDVIDLSALFDVLGIAPADRADHVVFNQAGGDTTITVTDGSDATIAGFSVLVENASLDATDIADHKIVVDES